MNLFPFSRFLYLSNMMKCNLITPFFLPRLSVTCIDNFTELSLWRQSNWNFRTTFFGRFKLNSMLSCGSTKAKTVAVMSSLAFEVFCCLTYIFSKAAVVFGKISHEDYTWERETIWLVRESPPLCVSRSTSRQMQNVRAEQGEEKNLRLFLTIARQMIILL